MKLNSFEVYQLFHALTTHFKSDSYDFFKYNGKLKLNREAFLKRKDKFFYQKLSHNIPAQDIRDFIIANILAERKWIKEFTTEEAVSTFNAYKRVNESLSYTFSNEVQSLFDVAGGPAMAFKIVDSYPPVVTEYIGKRLSIQTFVIMNKFIGFKKTLDFKLENDYIWTSHSRIIDKYEPFLKYDESKMKEILLRIVKEST